MAIEHIKFIKKNFPIETDLCCSVYRIASTCIYDKKHVGIRESGLHGVRVFYSPKPKEIIPILFGTLYNGSNYAEVLFRKAQKDEFGKLEITLCGNDMERLKGIQHKMEIEIEKELNSRKSRNGHKK